MRTADRSQAGAQVGERDDGPGGARVAVRDEVQVKPGKGGAGQPPHEAPVGQHIAQAGDPLGRCSARKPRISSEITGDLGVLDDLATARIRRHEALGGLVRQ